MFSYVTLEVEYYPYI